METASLLSQLQTVHRSPTPHAAKRIRDPMLIPSLERGTSWPASPQIAARFSYADTWADALCGITLLGLADIANALVETEIQDIVACRLRNWTDSPIHRYRLLRVTLFGVNRFQSEEVYLLWGGSAEPKILSYIGNYEVIYPSLNAFLLAYCNLNEDRT